MMIKIQDFWDEVRIAAWWHRLIQEAWCAVRPWRTFAIQTLADG
jgi:hypothetical protein